MSNSDPVLDGLPGFRRRFRIEPAPGRVRAAVEDDYHCMAVTLTHDSERITAIDCVMDRVPWTTCPGASLVLQQTFAGHPLAHVARRGEKQANCTHLHDLAVFAAAHAADIAPLTYNVLVSDPLDGLWHAEIRRDGHALLRLSHRDDVLVSPGTLAGTSLLKLRAWIETLTPDLQEAARILQWAMLIAHGRTIPMDRQSDAGRMPPNCFTFQPDRKRIARRVGVVRDFSSGAAEPLDHLGPVGFSPRQV